MRESQRPALTRVELLVALSVVAALVGLGLPAVQKVREVATQSQCVSHLKQMTFGALNFESVYGSLPANRPLADGLLLYDAPGRPRSPGAAGFPDDAPLGSMFFHLLPYIEHDVLWRQAGAGDRFGASLAVCAEPVRMMVCPSRHEPFTFAADTEGPDGAAVSARFAPGDYAANALLYSLPGRGGVFPRFADITDGLANTVLMAELGKEPFAGSGPGTSYEVPWPHAPEFRAEAGGGRAVVRDWELARLRGGRRVAGFASAAPGLAGSPHPNGVLTAVADGSVRAVRFEVAPAAWLAACTPAGSEVTDLD